MKTLKAVFVLSLAGTAIACTGIRTISAEGDFFRGRTMKFAAYIPTDVVAIPRGLDYSGTTMSGDAGLEWTTRYSAVGANGFGLPHILDGVNEEGLSAAAFYFANYVGYQEEPEESRAS